MRRMDIPWRDILPTWSTYDLEALERDIQEEKMRRTAKHKKGFLVP